MKSLAKEIKIAVRLFAVFGVLAIVYTLFITLVAQVAVPHKAVGSLITVDGKVIGSEFIGQSFTSPRYFHGRPSAANYQGDNSGGSNYGPTSARLIELVKQRIEQVRRENGLASDAPIPADLVLASGSGLDPDISVEGALLQVPRVAKERGLAETGVKSLVEDHIEKPQLGFLGQERVNVLRLNLALDGIKR